VRGAGYPAGADPAKTNMPLTIVILTILVIYVTMVYGRSRPCWIEAVPDPHPLLRDIVALPYRQRLVRRLPAATAFAIVRPREHLLRPVVSVVVAAGTFVMDCFSFPRRRPTFSPGLIAPIRFTRKTPARPRRFHVPATGSTASGKRSYASAGFPPQQAEQQQRGNHHQRHQAGSRCVGPMISAWRLTIWSRIAAPCGLVGSSDVVREQPVERRQVGGKPGARS